MVSVPVPRSPAQAGADEPTSYSTLKVLVPDGTAIITTWLVSSLRVNAPPISNPVERFKDVKQVQCSSVAVPANAEFCPSVVTMVMVTGIVSGLSDEFIVPERVPAGELL